MQNYCFEALKTLSAFHIFQRPCAEKQVQTAGMTLPYFYNQRECYGMTHLLYSVMIMSGYEGQEISGGPSVVQNIPCGREGPEGLHLSMENFCNRKA